jgi:hypothetical protein
MADRLKKTSEEYYHSIYMPLIKEKKRKAKALYKEFEITREIKYHKISNYY